MDTNGYTAVGFRTRSTHCTQHSNDVGLFLFNQIYYRTAHNFNESKVSGFDRYKYKADRSAETDAARFKGIGIKYTNSCELYN